MPGKLYLVATPIGNLEDITLRALRLLKEADAVLSEDTRVTRKLFAHFGITTPLIPYYQHSREDVVRKILAMLERGKNLALVTCAGTPGVSDPGPRLITAIYDAFGDAIVLVPIPGASAVTAIASVSGVPMDEFHFFGYPPAKKGRQGYFRDVAANPYPGILFESPHRIRRTMDDLVHAIGEDRHIVVGRELTKIFETIRRGRTGDLCADIAQEKPRGEYVILVEPQGKLK